MYRILENGEPNCLAPSAFGLALRTTGCRQRKRSNDKGDSGSEKQHERWPQHWAVCPRRRTAGARIILGCVKFYNDVDHDTIHEAAKNCGDEGRDKRNDADVTRPF
jgi:hypothetical protein